MDVVHANVEISLQQIHERVPITASWIYTTEHSKPRHELVKAKDPSGVGMRDQLIKMIESKRNEEDGDNNELTGNATDEAILSRLLKLVNPPLDAKDHQIVELTIELDKSRNEGNGPILSRLDFLETEYVKRASQDADLYEYNIMTLKEKHNAHTTQLEMDAAEMRKGFEHTVAQLRQKLKDTHIKHNAQMEVLHNNYRIRR